MATAPRSSQPFSLPAFYRAAARASSVSRQTGSGEGLQETAPAHCGNRRFRFRFHFRPGARPGLGDGGVEDDGGTEHQPSPRRGAGHLQSGALGGAHPAPAPHHKGVKPPRADVAARAGVTSTACTGTARPSSLLNPGLLSLPVRELLSSSCRMTDELCQSHGVKHKDPKGKEPGFLVPPPEA